MRFRTLLLSLVLAAIAVFVAINWSAFTAPTQLSLVFAHVDGPVGLITLGLLVLGMLVFGVYMAIWRGTVLLENRQLEKQLQAQRALAEQAEASRLAELRETLVHEMGLLGDRIAQVQDSLRTEIRENSNSLAATIGEIDDRMQKLPR